MKTYYVIPFVCACFVMFCALMSFTQRKYDSAISSLIYAIFPLALIVFMVRSDHKDEDRRKEFNKEMEEFRKSFRKE